MSIQSEPVVETKRQDSELPKVLHWINGKSCSGMGSRTSAIYNPATGKITKKVALASKEDVEKVVAAASAAFPSWSSKPPLRRARVLFKFRELFERDIDEIARMISSEHGKVFSDAKGEATRGMEVV
ncbi:MAG: aldehyde dehydrogenase family protein, partial [Granulicella sp.]